MSVSKNLIFDLFLFLFVSALFASSVSGQGATGKVQIIPVNGGPLLSVDPLPASVRNYSATSDECLTPEFKATYLGTQAKYDAYVATQDKRAACISGHVRSAVLGEKYAETSKSIEAIERRIASLKKVSVYVNGLKDVNGLKLFAVPAGGAGDRPFPTEVNISMQCLKDGAGKIIQASVAVGDRQSTTAQIFQEITDGQSALLEQVRRDNNELKEKSDRAKADKKKAGKKVEVSAGESVDLGFFFLGVVGKVAKDFIPVLPEDLEQSYVAFSKNNSYLSLGINFFLKDGKVQRNNEIGLLKTYLNALKLNPFKGDAQKARIKKIETLLAHTTLRDPFVEVNLQLDQIVYSDVEIPEETVLIDIRNATVNHLKRYESLRDQFIKARDEYTAEKEAIEKSNNCG